MQYKTILGLAAALVCALPAPAQKASSKRQWADDVPFFTDWEDAIKEVQATGKMLFIYNGWQRKGT